MRNVKMATLNDIAKKLGLSVNTVSRALRDCSDIGEKTKALVKKTAEEMGYQPNSVASFMRTKKSNIIAVFVSSITNPFFSICMDYIFDYLTDKGYHSLIIMKKSGFLQIGDVVRCMQNGACGVLTFIDLEKETADYCDENEIPILLCGDKPQDDRVSAVYTDGYRCGKLVAREAIKEGSKRPCYVNLKSVALVGINLDRQTGFMHTLEQNGINCDGYFYAEGSEHGLAAIKKNILKNNNDFIFCFNDEIATNLLELIDGENGFNAEVWGVDGVFKYLSFSRKVNSVGGDLGALSKRCAQIIIKKIELDDKQIVREVFPTEIILK